MTTHSDTPSDERRATITREEMDEFIAAGRAEPWTHPIPDRIPTAALLDGAWVEHTDRPWELRSGHWYVVWEDNVDVYELAPQALAVELTDYLARMRVADAQVTKADAQASASTEP